MANPEWTEPNEWGGESAESDTTPPAGSVVHRIKMTIGKRLARQLGRFGRWERESAAASIPLRGGFTCPICGDDQPHHHGPVVTDAYHNKGARR